MADLSNYTWRKSLLPASFRGSDSSLQVHFHVEGAIFVGGRRIALHEYPKRDTPYAEDMGRRARRYRIHAYLIHNSNDERSGNGVAVQRDKLKDLLEEEGSGFLTVYQSSSSTWRQAVVVEEFSVTEQRERGGYIIFEIGFVEVGSPANQPTQPNTQQSVFDAATNAEVAAGQSFTNEIQNFSGI